MRRLSAIVLALAAGCSSLGIVQKAVEPYSVEASFTVTDDAGNLITKGVWANSRFIAVDLDKITVNFVIHGPMVYGGPIVELKRFSAGTATGRQVWDRAADAEGGPYEADRVVVGGGAFVDPVDA